MTLSVTEIIHNEVSKFVKRTGKNPHYVIMGTRQAEMVFAENSRYLIVHDDDPKSLPVEERTMDFHALGCSLRVIVTEAEDMLLVGSNLNTKTLGIYYNLVHPAPHKYPIGYPKKMAWEDWDSNPIKKAWEDYKEKK